MDTEQHQHSTSIETNILNSQQAMSVYQTPSYTMCFHRNGKICKHVPGSVKSLVLWVTISGKQTTTKKQKTAWTHIILISNFGNCNTHKKQTRGELCRQSLSPKPNVLTIQTYLINQGNTVDNQKNRPKQHIPGWQIFCSGRFFNIGNTVVFFFQFFFNSTKRAFTLVKI